MSWWQALILGLVEGVTEYLPVSSTGHLILAERALGIVRTPASDAYAICIQAGAIVAVLGLYRERVIQMLRGLMGRDGAGLRLLVNLFVAFLPAAVLGFLFDDLVEELLFGLWPVVFAWGVGGLVILGFRARVTAAQADTVRVGASAPGTLDDITWKTALIIGFAQCLALWPGTSRSLATILGGVLVGLSMGAAVEFSFLLGLLTLGAATSYAGIKHADELLAAYGPVEMGLGFLMAMVSAAISVKWLVGWLQSHGMGVFAGWRLGLAAVVAALLLTGHLAPT